MNDLQVLVKARNLIINEENHFTGDYARNAEGYPVSSVSPTAVQFCAVGAISHVVFTEQNDLSHDLSNAAYFRVVSMLTECLFTDAKYSNTDINVIDFNDSHSHAEVIELFDRAIARELKKIDIPIESEVEGVLV